MAPSAPFLHWTDARLHDRSGTWTDFLEDWMPQVYGWCRRLGGPRVDAEACTVEVFQAVNRRLEEVWIPSAFPIFVYGLARAALRRRRRWDAIRRLWRAPVLAPSPLSELAGHLQRSLDRLPWNLREAVVLVEVEERSPPEVSALLDRAPGEIRDHVREGRALLRHALAGLDILPAPGGRVIPGPGPERRLLQVYGRETDLSGEGRDRLEALLPAG